MKPTSRLRILDHFKKNQTATVRELSSFMGMTGANIRHHLSVLESIGLLEVVGIRNGGRGRPIQVYGLSRRFTGDGLDILATAMFGILRNNPSNEEKEHFMLAIAKQIAGEVDDALPVTKRLVRTVERLNELHYQARWEASSVGPRLVLGHCPYAAIIATNPELCRLDALVLNLRLGSPVEQSAKLQVSDKSIPFCAFILK